MDTPVTFPPVMYENFYFFRFFSITRYCEPSVSVIDVKWLFIEQFSLLVACFSLYLWYFSWGTSFVLLFFNLLS